MNAVTAGLVVVALLSTAPSGASDCSGCHPKQHQEWRASLHAHSADDPLYLAMRAWAERDAGAAVTAMCATCHTVPIEGTTERTDAVTCEVCHKGHAAAPGAPGWRVDPEVPVGTAGGSADAPHAARIDHDLITGRLCLVCHGELRNPNGVPLCTTGPESEQRVSRVTCLGCHMREADHSLPGATRELLRRAAHLGVDIRAGEAVVTVVNRGAGHALPTGPVLRQVHLEVQLLDENGEAVARHREIFARVLEDGAGNAPAPPWRAVKERSVTTLMPQESRRFSYELPDGAATISARLVFHRAPPPLVDKFGLQKDPLFQPIEMARMERNLR